MNRREFLNALSVSALAASNPISLFGAVRASETPHTFTMNGRELPLIFEGESISASRPIRRVRKFAPWFGTRRPCVNPAAPVVRGSRLEFREPGEYYVYVDGSPVKAVVFSRKESVSAGVLRLFDFCVANNIYFQAHDPAWYQSRVGYLKNFFFSDQPMILSCGPTHQMFRMLIARRFGLPTRVTSANGAFYSSGELVRAGHNIPEVYLPEYDRFVAFDLNVGYVPLGLDAIGIGQRIRKWGPEELPAERIESLGVPIHCPVNSHPVSGVAFRLLDSLKGDGTSIVASRSLLTRQAMNSRSRANGARVFYNGAGYWGALANWAKPHGTEFLEGHQQFALLEDDPSLKALVAAELTAESATLLSADEVREHLRCGSREAVERRDWDLRFVADDERREPLPPLTLGLR